MTFKILIKLLFFSLFLLFFSTNAYSLSLKSLIKDLYQNDFSIKSSENSVKEAQNDVSTAWNAFLPEFDAKIIKGDENKYKYEAANDHYNYEELDLTLKQKIWDFGESSSDIEQKYNAVKLAELDLKAEKMTIIVDAVEAYLGYIDAVKKYESEIESLIAKIEATGQEESRVKKGSGMPSDVLQAKADLATSQKDKIKAEGDLQKAKNKFVKVFKMKPPKNIDSMQLIELSSVGLNQLPNSLDSAIEISMVSNIDYQKKIIDLSDAEQDIISSKSDFLPDLDFESTFKHKYNVSGTKGGTQEVNAKITLSIPLQPWQDFPDYKNKKMAYLIAESDLDEEVYTITQTISDQWQDFQLASLTRDYAKNKIVISEELLSIKKRERQLDQADAAAVTAAENAVNDDRKTLIDDETALTESSIDILETMGVLTLASLNDVPITPADNEISQELTESSSEETEQATETAQETETEQEAKIDDNLEAVPVEEVIETELLKELVLLLEEAEAETVASNDEATTSSVEEEPAAGCSSNTYIGQQQDDGSWKTVCKE